MKNNPKYYIFLLLLLISFNGISAVKIMECVDENGEKSFQKSCPPGTTAVNEKRISTGSKAASENKPVTFKSKSNVTATMYSIPTCSPCNAVRELLQIKNISLTEINVEGDVNKQTELTELNGSLNVPITLIGDKKLSGYNRSELISALKAAGWSDPNASPDKKDENKKKETEK